LAAVLVASSLGGILLPDVYAKETPSWAAQGYGQDWVDLLFVAPLLALCASWSRRGRLLPLLLLEGTFFYLLYAYVLYAFCVHFNSLYFLYIAGLGLSAYGLVLLGLKLSSLPVDAHFDRGRPTRVPAAYLFLNTLAFYVLWLSQDVPALLSGEPPKSLAEVGLVSNPIHILDLGIVLPAMLIASVALWRKRPFGYLFFPVMMAFCLVMAVALLGMVIAMKARGVTDDLTVAYVFAVLSVTDSWVLWHFLRVSARPPVRFRKPDRGPSQRP
jgi:hypothetical protein